MIGLMELVRGGETNAVEFKSSLRVPMDGTPPSNAMFEKLQEVVMKEIAAFLNAQGGVLLIGVDDAGRALGLEPDYASSDKIGDKDGFERHLRGLVGRAFGKTVSAALTVTFPILDGKEIARVDIPAGAEPTFLEVTDKNGVKRHVFYIRSGNKAEEIPSGPEQVKYVRGRWTFERRPTPQLELKIIPQEEPIEVILTPESEWPELLIGFLKKDDGLIKEIRDLIDDIRRAKKSGNYNEFPKQEKIVDKDFKGMRLPQIQTKQTHSLFLEEKTREYLDDIIQRLTRESLEPDFFIFGEVFNTIDYLNMSYSVMGRKPSEKKSGANLPLYERSIKLYRKLKEKYDIQLDYMIRKNKQARCLTFQIEVENTGSVKSGDLQIEISARSESEVALINHIPSSPHEVDEYLSRKEGLKGHFVPQSIYGSEPDESFHHVSKLTVHTKSLAPGQATKTWSIGAVVLEKHDKNLDTPALFLLKARITSDEIPSPLILMLETEIDVRYYPKK